MLARWNPWQDVFDTQREMADLMRRTFGSFGQGGSRAVAAWTPAVDVFSREGDLVVRAELPGVDPEKDVDISLQDGVLSIRGERRHEERRNGDSYYRVESTYGTFQRTVVLPDGVKPEDIKASYENGILEVVVPKAAELTAAKRIPISVGDQREALEAKGEKK